MDRGIANYSSGASAVGLGSASGSGGVAGRSAGHEGVPQSHSGELSGVPIDDPLRGGPLLSGATARRVVEQVVDLVFPEWHLGRPAVAIFYGLTDPRPTPPTLGEVVGVTEVQMRVLVHRITARGETVRLRPEVWPELTMLRTGRAQNAWRSRFAEALGLPPPVLNGLRPHWWTSAAANSSRVGTQVLAAAGPLYFDEVQQAVARSRRWVSDPVSDDTLTAALLVKGAAIDPATGKWRFLGLPEPKYEALLAAAHASGRARHTQREVAGLLERVGYSPLSVNKAISTHPLIERVSWNRYRFLGSEPHAK